MWQSDREYYRAMDALHVTLKNVIVMYMLICAAWGIYNGMRQRPASESYRTTLLIAEFLFVIQALLGLELLGEGRTPGQGIHFLYGILSIAVLPTAIGYIGRGRKRESLWLGLACLAMFGLALRAAGTGGLA